LTLYQQVYGLLVSGLECNKDKAFVSEYFTALLQQ